jgi:hypothetical protein
MYTELLDIALRLGLTLATGFLFGIIFLAYHRTRTRRMLLISVGFGIFFLHALITIPELISEAYQITISENLHLFIHLIALVFILLGILKD